MNVKLIVISSVGKRKLTLEDVDISGNWGSVKQVLKEEYYNINDLVVTDSTTRTDLVNDDAVLTPNENNIVKLYLYPKETKSGSEDESMILDDLLVTKFKRALTDLVNTNGESNLGNKKLTILNNTVTNIQSQIDSLLVMIAIYFPDEYGANFLIEEDLLLDEQEEETTLEEDEELNNFINQHK